MAASSDFSGFKVLIDGLVDIARAGNLEVAKRTRKEIITSFGSYGRYKAGPAGRPPGKRRSGLYNSFQVAELGGAKVAVTSNSRYAVVHELGLTIYPRFKKALTIPLNEAAAAFSEDKGTTSLRNYKFTPRKSKSGDLILVGGFLQKIEYYKTSGGKRRTVENKAIPAFILKRSSTMRKRPYVAPAMARLKGSAAFKAWAFGANRVVKQRFPGLSFREGAV